MWGIAVDSGLDLRLIYFIGGLVAVLVLLLVSFVLNARRASRLENTLDELQAQLSRANAQLDDTAKSLDDLYGRRKRGELNLPQGEEETLATEIKKADGTTTTLGDAISELYYKLGESSEEQEKAYANIIAEQQNLHESMTQIKELLASGTPHKHQQGALRSGAYQADAQYQADGAPYQANGAQYQVNNPQYQANSDVAYIDEDTPVTLSHDDISSGLSSLTRSLAAQSNPVPQPAVMGRDPMNPLGMGAPEGAAAARSFPRPDDEQSAGTGQSTGTKQSAGAEQSREAPGSSGASGPDQSAQAAAAASYDSDAASLAVPAVSQSAALEQGKPEELDEPEGLGALEDLAFSDGLALAAKSASRDERALPDELALPSDLAAPEDLSDLADHEQLVDLGDDAAEQIADQVATEAADAAVAQALDEVGSQVLSDQLSDADLVPLSDEPSLSSSDYNLGVEFSNPFSDAALASSFAPAEATAKLADDADFTADLDLGALSADVPDSGIYLPEGSDLAEDSPLTVGSALTEGSDLAEFTREAKAQAPTSAEFEEASDELRFDALSTLTARYARKQAEKPAGASAGQAAGQSQGTGQSAGQGPGQSGDKGASLTIDFAEGSDVTGSELKIKVSGHSAHSKQAQSRAGNATVVDMIYDPDYVRKRQAEKPFGINVETLNKAHEYIAAGISLSELAAKTGLSEEELRLLYDVDEDGKIKESVDFTQNGGLDVAGAAGLSDEELTAHSEKAQLSFAEPEMVSWRQSLGEPSGASLDAVQAQDAAGSLASGEHHDSADQPKASPPRTPDEALDQDERSTIETMMADQSDPFAHVSTPAAEEPVAGSAATPAESAASDSAALDESEELDEKEALVQKLEQNKAKLRQRKAQEKVAAEAGAEEEDERSALQRKLKAGRTQRSSQHEERARTEDSTETTRAEPADKSAAPQSEESEAARLANSIIAGRRAKAQEPAAPSTGDAELDALSAALIAETERVAAVPLADNKANVTAVAQALVSALSAEEKEQLKSDPNYQQDLARDIAAALAEQTQDDQVDLRSLQAEAVVTPAYSSPTQAIAQNTTPSGAPRAPMMPLRRRGARRQAAQAALNPAPIGSVEAVGAYGSDIAPVPDVPEGFGAVPTAPMRPMGGPAVRPGASAMATPGMAAPGMAAPSMAASGMAASGTAMGLAEPEYYGAAPSAAALLARGPQSSGRGLNAMLSPNPNMGVDPMGAPVDSKLSQALAQMGQVAGRGASGGFKAKDLARASANPGLNFSAGTAMNPGMADMLGAPLGMGTIDGPFTGGMGYEDDDPTAVLNEVVNNGLNSVAPLTQEQLDTLNQLQAGLAAPEPQRQHYANYQARNAYGIKR